MTASLITGKPLAEAIQTKIRDIVTSRVQQGHHAPGLAVILVGDDPASHIYVRNKRKACEAVGMCSHAYDLPIETSEHELLALIDTLNNNPDVSGILVQLPLPPLMNTSRILEHIAPAKDVDGLHPYNLGRLAQRTPLLRPCTPYGIIQLLKYYALPTKGKHAVIVGASNIVGRPMALELLLAKATVTVCHRFTIDLASHIRNADVIISATGVPDLIHIDWLNSQQIIVDIGIHRLADGSIRGDLDFIRAREKVAWITPVPGGVGPMTITTLLQNTLYAATGFQDVTAVL
jgi:methylenetetrahydrofolate dehydrogenase (NADP+)/methenyltetrahydrofolate cyclohydrolase